MPNVDEEWVKQQFQAAKVKVGVGNTVLKLLAVWNETKLGEAAAKEAVELFSKVALNHSLITPNENETWVPAQPGFIVVGDEVRVMHNAFSDDTGRIHNGRRGKVVAVRYGDVIFRSTDNREPFLDGVHYSPYKLEKRMK
jgi:hypothetical protein